MLKPDRLLPFGGIFAIAAARLLFFCFYILPFLDGLFFSGSWLLLNTSIAFDGISRIFRTDFLMVLAYANVAKNMLDIIFTKYLHRLSQLKDIRIRIIKFSLLSISEFTTVRKKRY